MRRFGVLALLFASSVIACGANATDGDVQESEVRANGYHVEMTTVQPVVESGSNASLNIRVLDGANHAVTSFDDLHTQTMHVVAVSSDLKQFVHVHPTLGAQGVLSVDVPVNAAQPYNVFFEYDPAGTAGPQTNRAALMPKNAVSVAPNLAADPYIFAGGATRFTVVSNTRVELVKLAHPMIMTGMATTFRVAVKTTDGAAVTDMVDWLGMPAHAIVLSEDESTFIHAHGMHPGAGGHPGHHPHDMGGMDMGGMDMGSTDHTGHTGMGGMDMGGTVPAASANLLDIDVTFPKAGLYKLFVQFQRGNEVITAPFVVRATQM